MWNPFKNVGAPRSRSLGDDGASQPRDTEGATHSLLSELELKYRRPVSFMCYESVLPCYRSSSSHTSKMAWQELDNSLQSLKQYTNSLWALIDSLNSRNQKLEKQLQEALAVQAENKEDEAILPKGAQQSESQRFVNLFAVICPC